MVDEAGYCKAFIRRTHKPFGFIMYGCHYVSKTPIFFAELSESKSIILVNTSVTDCSLSTILMD